jgi:hypothetical protein
MNHIGIDLGSRESQVCVRTSAGTIVEEARRPTRELAAWLATQPVARGRGELPRPGTCFWARQRKWTFVSVPS